MGDPGGPAGLLSERIDVRNYPKLLIVARQVPLYVLRVALEPELLSPLVDSFAAWPVDILRPSDPTWSRLQQRIGEKKSEEPALPEVLAWREPEWEDVAPGISCKPLATDMQHDRVSMLVRLAPDTAYPPHRHTGVEKLFLLDGELWIQDRKLHPGDYNRNEPGTADKRVWSETGCICVLITSPGDVIG